MKTLLAVLIAITVSTAGLAQAQLWSGQLDSSRATNWTTTGVVNFPTNGSVGIPNYTYICQTLSSSASSDTINTALRNCHNTVAGSGGSIVGGVVKLDPGHYPMTGTIAWRVNGLSGSLQKVVLRGSGPDQTFLEWTALPTVNGNIPCPLGQGSALVCISDNQNSNAQCSFSDGTSARWNYATWSGPYTAGTTHITLSGITNGASPITLPSIVGAYLILDQIDQPATPAAFNTYRPFSNSLNPYVHDLHDDGVSPLPCGSARYISPATGNSRCVAEYHKVEAVTLTSPGVYDVTIAPGLNYTYWNADGTNAPQAFWCHVPSAQILGDGLEDLTIDNQNTANAGRGLIRFGGAFQSWVKNIRVLRPAGAYVMIFGGANIEIRDSYFYSITTPTFCSNPGGTVTYGIDPIHAGLLKVENNIFHQSCKPLMAQACFVCVFGYNFTVGELLQEDGGLKVAPATSPNHVAGTHMLLFESNETNGLNQDHGTGHGAGAGLLTAFRNRFTGYQQKNPLTGLDLPVATGTFKTPIIGLGMNRFSNYIGNILGVPTFASLGWSYQFVATTTTPTTSATSGYAGYMYSLGSSGDRWSQSDPIQATSSFRWGNFDYVTNNVRWCGNNLNTGWATTCGSTTEVPSGQSIPATETLPASFYLTSKPTWFGTLAWPAIGPDITGGQSRDTSGHVKNIPAAECFLNVMGGNVNGTGGALTFNWNLCTGTDTLAPAAPTGITVTQRMEH